MSFDEPLVLSPDVLIIPVGALPEPVREEIGGQGAFVLTNARARASSSLIDETTADLLGEFRTPVSVVDAVIRYSRRRGLDPEQTLDDSYGALRGCFGQGLLVAAGSEKAHRQAASLVAGQRVAAGTVVRCIQLLEDTELYQLAVDDGGLAALKLLRPTGSRFAQGALRREADVLAFLDGRVAPRLLGTGEVSECEWLALEWVEGAPANAVAAGLRRLPNGPRNVLAVCQRVAEAYAELHRLGVAHGDIHPGNVLVAPSGPVRLVDFGLARRFDDGQAGDGPPRGGVQTYLDPQYAEALTAGQAAPPASPLSEQFSVGALLYELVTGAKYADFSVEHGDLLRQLADPQPLPFTRRSVPPWPELEAVLARALRKDPDQRFSSVADLAAHLSAIGPPTSGPSHGGRGGGAPSTEADSVLSSVLSNASPGGRWFEHGVPQAPYCSVAYGAAGVAAALLRVSEVRGDPQLLALADEWVVRARREAGRPHAFTSDVIEVTDEITGRVTPFHRLSGVHAVQALVSHALGDPAARQQAVDRFIAECSQPCTNPDLTLGRSGVLLGAAMLMESIAGARFAELGPLVRFGNATLDGLWAELDALAPIADCSEIAYLGVAHGWAGLLLATLRWCRAAAVAVPSTLPERLDQLAGLAQPVGMGVRWPWTNTLDRRGAGNTMPGWCNGTAGHVHLWTTAHAETGEGRWADLAERAAWDVYTTPSNIAQLCCGFTGQAYALLDAYRHTGQARWRTAATELATQAARALSRAAPESTLSGSLHKGDVGVAVLAADLEAPEAAAMPFFGRPG